MSALVDRLVELRRHLAHLRVLRPRVSRAAIERDLSLHNDVLFSLLAARRGDRFEDYTQAVRHLVRDSRFPPEVVRELERLDPVERFVEIVAAMEADEG